MRLNAHGVTWGDFVILHDYNSDCSHLDRPRQCFSPSLFEKITGRDQQPFYNLIQIYVTYAATSLERVLVAQLRNTKKNVCV